MQLLLAKELKLLTVGRVSVDGTKVKANASKRRSIRYDRAVQLREQLRGEVADLLAEAERADTAQEADVSTGVKLPTYAGLKFPSLLTLASHCDLPNTTPPRMLSVWFQSTEGTEVITWERLFMLHELHAQDVSISAIARQTQLLMLLVWIQPQYVATLPMQ